MKYLVILILFGASLISNAEEYYGNYVTRPEIVPGFEKPYPDVVKKAIERMKWRMENNKHEISIQMKDSTSKYKYTVDGDYLLATDGTFKNIELFIPFYVKDSDTIYGLTTVFFREKEI